MNSRWNFKLDAMCQAGWVMRSSPPQAADASSGSFPELLSIYHLWGDPALRIR